MHGRKRAAPGTQPSVEQTAALAKKVATYRQLGGLAMKHVRAGATVGPPASRAPFRTID